MGQVVSKPGGSGGGGGSGDVTDVLAGTGITVTNPGGPQPSVALSAGSDGQILKMVSGVPTWVSPMSIEYTRSAETVGTTPVSLTAGGTSIQTRTGAGVRWIKVDTTNMAAGDQFKFSVHEKAVSGGTQRKTEIAVLTGQQDGLLFAGPFPLSDGWDFSAEKLAGTDCAFDVETLVEN